MAHYPTTPNRVLAKRLGCSVAMVKNYAYAKGLRKASDYTASGINGHKPFDVEHVDYIKVHYATASTASIAQHIGHPAASVYRLANKMGLRKSEAYLATAASGRMGKGSTLGASTRFQKGHATHNKGKRMPEHIRAKVARTWFAKGNLPHNTKEDGYTSIRKDSSGRHYIFIRTALGVHVHLHRKLWTDAHGAVPKGHCIAFRDGDSMNCTLENLECITLAERMSRTTIHNYPPDMRKAMRVLGKLRKTIREHGEE